MHMTPDVFLLAHEVYWDNDAKQIKHEESQPNAWFVELAASRMSSGAVREFMRVATHSHKWCLWRRDNEPRVRCFDWEKLGKKVRL